MIFFVLTTIPPIGIDHLTAFSQWKLLKSKISRLSSEQIKEIISNDTSVHELNSSLALVEKVQKKDELKRQFKKILSSHDQKEIDELYNKISLYQESPMKNICIDIQENPGVINNSKLPYYFSFHVYMNQNETYSFGKKGTLLFNLRGEGGVIKVKMPGEEDQIFDFGKNVKIIEKTTNILRSHFQQTNFEILLESGSICSDESPHLRGRFYFD